MLNYLKKEASLTTTENGAVTHSTSGTDCLDLFFRAGALRFAGDAEIARVVRRAYAEDTSIALKIIFFARDIRGGLGERRFFRIAMNTLANENPDAVLRNLWGFAEFGRYDDLMALLHTPCEKEAIALIRSRLNEDTKAMEEGKPASLLAKWLPSVNTSSAKACADAHYLAKKLGMNDKTYRQTLSKLRKYTDVIENRLRKSDYTFDYAKQTSGSMLKYRKAFIRNDNDRYQDYLDSVSRGEASMHTDTLYPYEIVRKCMNRYIEDAERKTLDTTWKALPVYGNGKENYLAVVDGSYSMTCGEHNHVRPLDAALSLGIYFAEHNKGEFANHFITFSMHPQLVEIKGSDIAEKVQYCLSYDECSNTNLEAVFDLILDTAVKNHLPQEEIPTRLFIISDMEFDGCVKGGNTLTLYEEMQNRYAKHGYKLPSIVFWNVNSRNANVPVQKGTADTCLVSGFTPMLFDMVVSGEISPETIMQKAIGSERYAKIS